MENSYTAEWPTTFSLFILNSAFPIVLIKKSPRHKKKKEITFPRIHSLQSVMHCVGGMTQQ
jgi:hypothetical protein